VLDQASPNNLHVIYGSTPLTMARDGRKKPCAGIKGVTLDPAFAERHMPGGVPFDATIFTEPSIDHLDLQAIYPPYYDNLTNTYGWGDEEFYDEVIADRSTPWDRQLCAGAPDGLCLETMFRSIARYDWIRDRHLAKPDNYSNAQSLAIPDNNTSGAVRTFAVRERGDLDSLRVKVTITHPDISQLRIELSNPAGATVVLKQAGTGSGANLNGWYPTDFTPAQPLAGLYGTSVNGTWRLRIVDTVSGGTGTLNSFILETWYDDVWPVGYYDAPLSQLCGRYALTVNDAASRTNNVVLGVLSHKTAEDKPSQIGDILWGFDPYRYDHAQMTEVIRWVLGEHFRLDMRP